MTAEVARTELNPIVLYLNSKDGASGGDDNNQVLFNFKLPLQKEEDSIGYALLSQFQCANSFANFSAALQNNTVKILNVMCNNATGIFDYTTYKQTIVIPDGHYTSTQLIDYLNTVSNYTVDLTGASPSPNWTSYSGKPILFMGLGVTAANPTGQALDSFVLNPVDNFFMGIQAAGAGSSSSAYTKTYTSGTVRGDHYAYAGLYLLYDDDTEGFMEACGFTDLVNLPNGMHGVGFTFNTLQDPVNSQAVSPTKMNTQIMTITGPTTLYIVAESLTVNSRHSNEDLDQYHILGTVPVNNFYGGLISFQATLPTYIALQSLNLTSLKVTIFDQNYKIVDFRGAPWTAQIYIKFATNSQDDQMYKETANMIQNFPALGATITDGMFNSLKRRNPYGGASQPLQVRKFQGTYLSQNKENA